MYKFLVNYVFEDVNTKHSSWHMTTYNGMYPPWNKHIKEALLIGYYSQKQGKWITSAQTMQQRANFEKVKQAFPESELTLLYLGLDIKEVEAYNPYEFTDIIYKAF